MEASVAAAIGTLLDLVIRKGHGKMAMLLSYLWLGATTLVAFFVRQLFRRKEEDGEHDSSISAPARSTELLSKVGKLEELEGGGGGGGQEPTHVFQFKFGFQIPGQSNSSRGAPAGEDGGSSSSTTVTSVSNYRFVSDGGRRGFVEAPQAMTLRIQESYIDSDGSVRSPPAKLDEELIKSRLGLLLTAVGSLGISDDEVKSRVPLAKHSPPRAESDGGVSKELDGELKSMMRLSLMSPESRSGYDSEEVGAAAYCEILGAELPDEEAGVPAGDHYRGGLSSDSESESGSDGYSVKDLSLDFDSDGLFPEKDVEADDADEASSSGSDVEEDDPVEFEQKSEATQLSNSPASPDEASLTTSHVGFDTEHGRVVLDQLAVEDESESLESGETNGTELSDSCGSDKESAEGSDEPQGGSEETQLIMESSDEMSTEEMEETESPWEHDGLLDRLRVDLKKAMAATGLPTILEESESPKPAEEGLEPWKPDAPRFLREDPMEGLHKFYRSYRDRMRKLDVLNRQQMYAIGFLQLKKDTLKPGATQKKPIIPAIASALSHNLRRRRSSDDPSEKLVRELRSGVELVYVGQTCLSWEFLRHQYETTRQVLLGSGGGGRPYNQSVGEEFQQFQVLLERFLENEPFQGPRVAGYAKNRCVLRRLLQVPVVREDCVKDTAEARRRRTKDAMTGEELEYVMEDSIRVFWDFVRSEKEETPSIVRGLFGAHDQVELQDPADSDFMADVQTHLRQKQKRLKDVLRSGNCIVKKFKNRQQQGGPSQDDLFFSQVDLKLVSRVLRMTRITTDQLVWCHKKLSRISFADRKLTREPSFLLFPC